MEWLIKTTDWQVCCLGQIAGGTAVAGGYFLFVFHSATAGGSAFFGFSGVGMGIGGNMSGVLNPTDYGDISSPWSTMSNTWLTCGVHPFSATDLNGAIGRISSFGGGIYIVGYSFTYITANPFINPDDYYFYTQSVGGLGYGASNGGTGLSGEVLKGAWNFLGESSLKPK
ncbi:hypothetical protein [Flavitalea sp.]|nr:hypothetical protein [Flavitalea sp.]